MCKPTVKELSVMIGLGLGTVVALMFTDFGLAGAALAGIFTVLAVVVEGRRSTQGESGAGS